MMKLKILFLLVFGVFTAWLFQPASAMQPHGRINPFADLYRQQVPQEAEPVEEQLQQPPIPFIEGQRRQIEQIPAPVTEEEQKQIEEEKLRKFMGDQFVENFKKKMQTQSIDVYEKSATAFLTMTDPDVFSPFKTQYTFIARIISIKDDNLKKNAIKKMFDILKSVWIKASTTERQRTAITDRFLPELAARTKQIFETVFAELAQTSDFQGLFKDILSRQIDHFINISNYNKEKIASRILSLKSEVYVTELLLKSNTIPNKLRPLFLVSILEATAQTQRPENLIAAIAHILTNNNFILLPEPAIDTLAQRVVTLMVDHNYQNIIGRIQALAANQKKASLENYIVNRLREAEEQ